MSKRKQFISLGIPNTPIAQEGLGNVQSGVEHTDTQPLSFGSSRSRADTPPRPGPPERTPSDPNQGLFNTQGRKSRWPRSKQHARKNEQQSPFPPSSLPKKRTRQRSRWLAIVAALFLIFAIVFSQGNGAVGAWFADTFRAVFGATATAQIEAWYLEGTDLLSRFGYQLSGQKVAAPWSVGKLPTPGAGTTRSDLFPMELQQIAPQVQPALTGEGTWLTQVMAPTPYDAFPLVAKTFYRPDPSHLYAVVTLQQFDSRFLLLHMVAGTQEPGGPRGAHGPGVIPGSDQQGNVLLAAFNGGFKYVDGQYGMMVGGEIYVPPQPGAATLAVTKEGRIIMGAWGVDPHLNGTNSDLAAWRQNASLLIDQGVINPLTHDGVVWGGTILNRAYTWRSGIGITRQGMLIYAAGNALTAETLADALQAAGAVTAMQTDINPFWVRAFLYQRSAQGALDVSKLNPAMQGSGTEYLKGTTRDFFYLTRAALPINQENG